MKQIAVFWDLDNTYWGLFNYYGKKNNEIIKIVDTIWENYKDESIRIFRAYADFDKVHKIQTEIQKRRVTPKHVFSSHNGTENRKNAGDIELM